ncbi:hypothetical protein C0J52_11279 [Blattella germanica]|nr:hypothetical protein C0J52_11279 [Blattella germanica]
MVLDIANAPPVRRSYSTRSCLRYWSKSPHGTYSMSMQYGCFKVQHPTILTTLGCRPTLFIIAISERNSSTSSAEALSGSRHHRHGNSELQVIVCFC